MLETSHTITKRDGRIVPFDKSKIVNAILKAFNKVDGTITEYARTKANNIADYIENSSKDKQLSIEDIQDLVVHGLMSTKRKDVASEYIEYRYKRNLIRNNNSPLMIEIAKKLMADNDEQANANVDAKSFGGRRGEAAEELFKAYALDNLMSPIARANHINNMIYTHDLGHYASGDHNCLSCPIDPLLENGFTTRQTDVRGAKSIGTACQLLAVIFQLQSLQQFGGVSATHLDWTLAVYVRKSFMRNYIIEYIKRTNEFTKLDLMSMIFNDIEIFIADSPDGKITVEVNEFDNWLDENKKSVLSKLNLSEDDFYFDNKDNLNPELYQSALFTTVTETKQAVEGLYHNLKLLGRPNSNVWNIAI